MPVELRCTHCEKPFTRPPSRVPDGSPFCSKRCHDDHRRQGMPKRTCETCGGEFTPYRANRDRARFCSTTCLRRAGRERVECPACGAAHEVRECDLRNERSRLFYCPACRPSAPDQRGRPTDVGQIELICANSACGKTLRRYASQVGKTGRVFCDKACRVAGKPRLSKKATVSCQRDGCDVSFQPRGKAAGKYCSTECAYLARLAKRSERACTGCGVTFLARTSDPDVYHSWDCYQAHRGTPVGARKRHQDGYVLIYAPGHPEAWSTGWAFEHRVLVSDLLGRPLAPREEVHHVNTVRGDNRTEGPLRLVGNHLRSGNLELWERSQPAGGRVGDRLLEAMREFERLGYAITPPGAPPVPGD